MKMKWNKKTIVGLVFMFPLLMVIVWFGFYQFAINRIETYINAGSAALNEKGYTISYDKLSLAGTLFEARATLSNLKLTRDSDLLAIHSPSFSVSMKPWDTHHLQFLFGENTRVSVPASDKWALSELSLLSPRGTLTLDDKLRPESLSLSIDTIRPFIAGKQMGLTCLFFQLAVSDLRAPLHSDGKLSFQIQGLHQYLGLSDQHDPLQFNLNYKLSGLEKGLVPQSLDQWIEGGGRLDVKSFDIDWLTLKINGNGKLSLDKKMRLEGSLEANFIGYADMLDLWVDAGYIPTKDANNLEFVINMIAGQPKLGKKEVLIPVTLKKGNLSVGPAKVLKIPPLK